MSQMVSFKKTLFKTNKHFNKLFNITNLFQQTFYHFIQGAGLSKEYISGISLYIVQNF